MSRHVTAQCVVLVGLKAPAPRSPLLLVGPEEDYRHGTGGTVSHGESSSGPVGNPGSNHRFSLLSQGDNILTMTF